MIERKTKRYCLVCSYYAHDYWRNDAAALEGMPSLWAVRGKPLTNLLCGDHSQQFDVRQKFLQTCDDRGDPETYANGVPFEVFIGFERRVKHRTAGIYSQDDALNLLQYMEKRLRVLQFETATGMHIWHHHGDPHESERVTTAEVVERAEWARWVEDYIPTWLATERNRTITDDNDSSNLLQIDADYDDDDRISGEE